MVYQAQFCYRMISYHKACRIRRVCFVYSCASVVVFLLVLSYFQGLWNLELVMEDLNTEQTDSKTTWPKVVFRAKYNSLSKTLLAILPLTSEKKPTGIFEQEDLNIDFEDVSYFNNSSEPDCHGVMQGELSVVKNALIYQKLHALKYVTDADLVRFASNCDIFRKSYVVTPVSPEEETFPLAYSIVIYRDLDQFENLLQAIYRPQNCYCIHVDYKATPMFKAGAMAIADCFDNVFIAHRLVNVVWGTYSVLEAELICMQDLWKHKWKYFINLTGHEFPLKSNLDIVRILKAFNGSNNMEVTIKRRDSDRTTYVYHGLQITEQRKEALPVPMTLTKGAVHILATRAFVDYILHDKRALTFRDWVRDTKVPDETFFSSLTSSPQLGVPGAYLGTPENDEDKYPFLARFKNWGSEPFDYPCYSKRQRRICVFDVPDLPFLYNRPEFFANKFNKTANPVAFQCLVEWHKNKTIGDIQQTRLFNAAAYSRFEFTWNHL